LCFERNTKISNHGVGFVVILGFYFISKVNAIKYYYFSTFTCVLSQMQLHFIPNIHNLVAIIKALVLHYKDTTCFEKSFLREGTGVKLFSFLAFDQ